MWRRVPRREVFIAVGDQRRKRVHMVRVLYHRDLIRLQRQKKEREENKVLKVFFNVFINYNCATILSRSN